jgi:hypothetical protein
VLPRVGLELGSEKPIAAPLSSCEGSGSARAYGTRRADLIRRVAILPYGETDRQRRHSDLRIQRQQSECASPAGLSFSRSYGRSYLGDRAMTSFQNFHAFAALRGDGLRPELKQLLECAANSTQAAVTIRHDGMSQSGPDPKSESVSVSANVSIFPRTSKHPSTPDRDSDSTRKYAP